VSEHQVYEQDLVELALGEVSEPRRSHLLSHMTGCLRCRATYHEVVSAVDAVVPTAPEAQPPAGFDLRVLSAMGVGANGAVRRPSTWFSRVTPGRVMLAAAAVVLIAAVGVVAGGSLLGGTGGNQAPPAAAPVLAADSAALETGDGATVGTAAVAWMHEDRVLVVQLNQAPVGVRYRCRVHMAEGKSMVLGQWQPSSPHGGTWVMPAPQGDLNGVQLVTDSGQVWSSAWLP
jgi:anti-sigma factor RsiW